MGISEDIKSLNARITTLERKQEEAKRVLAVEEHKLKTLELQLQEEGIEVSSMSDEEISELLDDLSGKIQAEIERITKVVTEAEKQYEAFQALT